MILLAFLAAFGQSMETEQVGPWLVGRTQDPMDDTVNCGAYQTLRANGVTVLFSVARLAQAGSAVTTLVQVQRGGVLNAQYVSGQTMIPIRYRGPNSLVSADHYVVGDYRLATTLTEVLAKPLCDDAGPGLLEVSLFGQGPVVFPIDTSRCHDAVSKMFEWCGGSWVK